jgi:hypothetical protein
MDTTVGVGGGVGGTASGTRVTAGAGASTGAGTKTSVGLAAGVTIRATVCFVELQVGRSRTATAASGTRANDLFMNPVSPIYAVTGSIRSRR